MARRKSVVEIQDVIIRLRKCQSIREIHRELKIHRTIIREIRRIASINGWLESQNPVPSTTKIDEHWNKDSEKKEKKHPLDNYYDELQRYVNSGYSFVVMHSLLKDRHPCDESTVRRYVKKKFPSKINHVIIRQAIAGEIMEVDFGYLGLSYNPETNLNQKTYLISGRLRYSRKAYREIIFNQRQETFFQCHINAFEFFNGVPEKVVPDNLKAAVIKAYWYDPLINRSYRSLAMHYNFLISPCLPNQPNHKGGVENDIKYVKRHFWPIFVESQKRKGRDICYSNEIAGALEKWNQEISEQRIIQGLGKTPFELFEEEHKLLNPLPPFRWSQETWKQCKVGRDIRIQFNKAFYSVPYKHVGDHVMVCGNNFNVRIFLENKEIATHPKAKREWEFIRNENHFPPNQEAYLSTTREGLLRKAGFVGSYTKKVLEKLFEDKVLDALRPARGILQLGKKYTNIRLEAACKRALAFNIPNYRSVKNILVKELDKEPEEQNLFQNMIHPVYRFAREKGFFK